MQANRRTLIVVVLIVAVAGCGRLRSTQPASSGNASDGTSKGRVVQLADVLRDIDAYPTPKGVSAGRWVVLVTELKKLLVARSKDGKTLSIAPAGSLNQVTDLAAVSNGAGTQATLTWTEVLKGDYNNDGEVSIADLGPMATYYGQFTNSGPDDGHKLVDGDSDPEIGIADLQPVAANYASHIEGYQIYRGSWNGTTTTWEGTHRPNTNPANPNWSADRLSPPPVSTRPAYTYLDDISGLTDKTNVRYKVTAYGDGAPGHESNEAVMAPTYFVSGTVTSSGVGLAGVTLTLTPGGLNATTAADGTYTITGVVNGTYTLTPTKAGYSFTPVNRSVLMADVNLGGQDFTATSTAPTYYVSGTVTSSGVGLAGVTLTLTPGGLNATTQADGTYTITGVADGSYTLTPTLLGYVFTPTNRSVTVSGADVAGQGFTAAPVGLASTPWPKFHADAHNTGLSSYVGAQTNTVKWSHATGNQVWSSPAIGADGTVYVGSLDTGVHALNPADGSVKWTYATGDVVLSSPAIGADGTVYVGSFDNSVYALNPAGGSVKWSHATGGDVWSSPAIGADGTVYVGGRDNNVYALNPLDGSVKWLHATGDWVDSSPAVGADGTVYVGSRDNKVYALNPADGSVKWSHATGNQVWSSPAIGADGTVYVGSWDNKVYALNPADGSVKWSYATGSGVESSPAIGADGTVYVGSWDNKVYALSPIDGSVKWSYATGDVVQSSPAIGADGTVYVGSYDFKVYAFGP